jgi:D-alanyl-D-alanine carboxypeptidase (penicillin-binding protein 5/6)
MSRSPLVVLAVALAVAAIAPASARAQDDARVPAIRAPSAIVVEQSTGDVAFARNASERRPIASTTKMMTALLSVEGAALDDVLTAAPYAAGPAETVIGLGAGERMTVRHLVQALMLASANDAAVTLATGISGSVPAFVREMNARARELGLRDTSYANPVGLDDPDNGSSARDLVRLAAALHRNPFLRRTTRLDAVDGVKTGRTSQAGYVLVGSATRDGVTVLSAVLGEPSEQTRDADTLALLRYGLSRYRRATPVRRSTTLARADLKYRDRQVRLVAAGTVRPVVRRGQRPRVRVVGAPAELDGPLTAGARVGTVEVRVDGRVVGRTPLVTATAVEEAGLGTRLVSVLGQPTTLLLVVAALACTVLLVLLRRRVVRRVGGRA